MIAACDAWVHISEDDVWDEIEKRYDYRTPQEHIQIKLKSIQHIEDALRSGKSVVFEFLVYEKPPVLVGAYQKLLRKRGIPFATKVLKPSVETILKRQKERGRASEMNIERQRRNAELQLACLDSDLIQPDWIVDSTGLSLNETYSLHFEKIVASQ